MNQISIPKGRYLITGGAGFIGSHLSERLLELGASVLCVDNFVTGRRENLTQLLQSSQFEFIEQDILTPLSVEGGLAGIFHLASPASPIDYAKLPIETLRVGSIGSDNILSLALEKKCPILVTSTSEVYGDPLEHPQKESYWGNVNPVGPRGCYDEAKRYLEALTMAYYRVHKLKTRIVRIFNTYGPRMRTNDGRVVPNFCIQAIQKTDLTIYGEGTQTRSFCYVDDMVEGLLRTFMCDQPEPINLGNPNERTIRQLAEFIIKLSGNKLQLSSLPLPVDDPKVRKPDISRAKKLLQWEPLVSFEEGMKKTFEYFRALTAVAD